jgi:hypothetical protein
VYPSLPSAARAVPDDAARSTETEKIEVIVFFMMAPREFNKGRAKRQKENTDADFIPGAERRALMFAPVNRPLRKFSEYRTQSQHLTLTTGANR